MRSVLAIWTGTAGRSRRYLDETIIGCLGRCFQSGNTLFIRVAVMTELQAVELAKFLQLVTFADCERLTDSDSSAGALYEAVQIVLETFCRNAGDMAHRAAGGAIQAKREDI